MAGDLLGGIKAVIKFYQTALGIEEQRRQQEYENLIRSLEAQQRQLGILSAIQGMQQEQQLFPLRLKELELGLEQRQLQTDIARKQMQAEEIQRKVLSELPNIEPTAEAFQKWYEGLSPDAKEAVVGSEPYNALIKLKLGQMDEANRKAAMLAYANALIASSLIPYTGNEAVARSILEYAASQGAEPDTLLDIVKLSNQTVSEMLQHQREEQRISLQAQSLAQKKQEEVGYRSIGPTTVYNFVVKALGKSITNIQNLLGAAKTTPPQLATHMAEKLTKTANEILSKYVTAEATVDDALLTEKANEIVNELTKQLETQYQAGFPKSLLGGKKAGFDELKGALDGMRATVKAILSAIVHGSLKPSIGSEGRMTLSETEDIYTKAKKLRITGLPPQ